MGGLSPYIQQISAFNDQGQGGVISGPTGMGGFLPAAWQAQGWANNDLENRMSGIVDSNGNLTRQPQTAAEMAYAQSALEKFGNQQQQNNQNQAWNMLQSSFGGAPGMGGGGGMGDYVPGMEDLGGSGGFSGGNYSIGASKGPGVFGQTKGGGTMTAALGSGTASAGPQGTIDNRTGKMINNSTGEVMARPSFGVAGQTRGGGMNQYAGGAGGGSSSGSVAGGYAVNSGLHDTFVNKMQEMLKNPGLSDRTVNQMIGKGADGLAQNENSAALELTDKANAAGGGAGAIQGGLQQLYQNFAGQKADNAREVRVGAEQDRENRLNQAMGISGDYLGKVQDRAAAMQLRQMQMGRDDRNQAMQMLMNKQYSVPQLSGGGQQFGISFGAGGGANQGNGPGSAQMAPTGPAPQQPTAKPGLSSRWGAPALQGQGGVIGYGAKAGGGGGYGGDEGGGDAGGGYGSPMARKRGMGGYG